MNERAGTHGIHQMIDLIYETAIEPGKWPELLHVLAGFIERHTQGRFELSAISEKPKTDALAFSLPKVTLSSAFERITHEEMVSQSAVEMGADEINLILLRHFTRAIKIAKRLIDLEEKHEVVVSLLNHLPIALFVVDEHAVILETNHRADQMLADQHHMLAIEGRLHARQNAHSKKLHRAIQAVRQENRQAHAGQALTFSDDSEAQDDLMLFITAIVTGESQQTRRFAVFASTRHSQPVSVPRQVSDFYGLTPREMEITAALVQGRSIKEIAVEARVSEHTVRSQVKSVLSKTNSRRQADLVRLVLTGPGSIIHTGLQQYQVDQQSAALIFKGLALPDAPKFIFLPDGRRMAYQEYGDPAGAPLVYCHSIMGSRLELAIDGGEAAKDRGFRLIIPDRPGIGCSDPAQKAGFVAWAEDLKALADFLALDRFCMAGFAMGGQYALATAFSLPKRVQRLSLASVGVRPVTADDYAAMLPFYRFNLRVLIHAPPVYRLFSTLMRKGFLSKPDNFFRQFGGQLAAGDRPIFEDPQFREAAGKNIREGWRQSAAAPCAEIENWMRPSWGFDLAAVKTPIDLWHGEDDHHVPCALGERLLAYLPQARRFVRPAQGHLMFYSHWPKMLDALLDT